MGFLPNVIVVLRQSEYDAFLARYRHTLPGMGEDTTRLGRRCFSGRYDEDRVDLSVFPVNHPLEILVEQGALMDHCNYARVVTTWWPSDDLEEFFAQEKIHWVKIGSIDEISGAILTVTED